MHPELSFHEHETAAFVERVLQGLDGVEVRRPTPTSLLGVIRGHAGEGPTVALRADIDALPILEESDLPFRSRNDGVMHACGHDGHTAMLLGATTLLARFAQRLRGEVRLVFQHAEELSPGGARELIDAGVLEGVDFVTGCHLISSMSCGEIAVPHGACMAASDYFMISIQGRGGHAAWPHETVDPVAIGAQIVAGLQHVVSRRTNPNTSAVVSVTQFHGGAADNIIPDTARLSGTIRSFDPQTRNATRDAISRLAVGIASAHDANAEVEYTSGYDAVVNDSKAADAVARQIELVDGVELVEIEPFMGADDMAYFLQQAPGAYFFVGTGSDEAGSRWPHHHPRFTIDERSLPHGVETYVRVVVDALQ